MQAIETKYICPTNKRGATIMAQCVAKRRFYPYRHELNIDENHKLAAIRLAQELEWKQVGALVSGTLRSGVQAHVFQDWSKP